MAKKYICDECQKIDGGKPCILDAGDDISCPTHCICGGDADWRPYDDCPEKPEAAAENKPLPKLTAAVFDLPDCPVNATFAFVHSDGMASFGWGDPEQLTPSDEKSTAIWIFKDCRNAGMFDKFIGKFDSRNWRKSIVHRPIPAGFHPGWCKIGKLVYCKITSRYGYIRAISKHSIYVRYTDDSGSYQTDNFIYLAEARLRPFTVDEIKELPGQCIVSKKYQTRMAVLEATPGGAVFVGRSDIQRNAEDLLNAFEFPDGSPCGVYEHYDAKREEWKK